MSSADTGQPSDLNDSISAQRRVIAATPETDPLFAEEVAVLAGLLEARYRAHGQADDLAEAVHFGRAAVDATPDDDAERVERLADLGMMLRLSFGRTGRIEDLDEAIELGREAVAAAPDEYRDRSALLSRLGVAMRIRFRQTGQIADLEGGIYASREAVRTAASDVTRAAAQNNLGLALQTRYDHHRDVTDLDEAVSVAREAVRSSAAGDPNYGIYLGNLGGTLKLRFDATGRDEDLAEAIEVGRQALLATPDGDPSRPSLMHNLDAALSARFRLEGNQDQNRAGTSGSGNDHDRLLGPPPAAGSRFPGPFGALCADVMEQNLDIWQAEALAPSLIPASDLNGADLERLSRSAATKAAEGSWSESIILVRLLMSALEGADNAERLTSARASVSIDFTVVAALALTSGADPELFSRALAAGLWARDWAAKAKDAEIAHSALHALALLYLLPYTTSQRPQSYEVDHVRWLRNVRAHAVNLPEVMEASTLAADGTLSPASPALEMPEPLPALKEAEQYARAAAGIADAAQRETDVANLVEILEWQARLGGEVSYAELDELRTQVPQTKAETPTRLETVADEFTRLAESSEPASDLEGLLDLIEPELAIAALGLALSRSSGRSPEAISWLIWLRTQLIEVYGDEQDKEDQAVLELGLMLSLYAAGFDRVPALGNTISAVDVSGVILGLRSGPADTAAARAAWLTYLAHRCADIPSLAPEGLDALAAAADLDPSIAERHGSACLFVEARLQFGTAASALEAERTLEAITPLVTAMVSFTALGLLSRVGDCLALLNAEAAELDVTSGLTILSGLMTISPYAFELDQNANRLIQLIYGQMLSGLLRKGVTYEFLIILFQVAKGWPMNMALQRPPPVVALDDDGARMLQRIGLAEGATMSDPALSALSPDFLDDETILVSWSDTLQRRPSANPADRLRNRQRRFDRHLSKLLAAADDTGPGPLQLDEVQLALDGRTALLVYFSGGWTDDEIGTAYLLITRDEAHVEIRADDGPAGDIWLRTGDVTAVTSPRGIWVAELRRQIQEDPMTAIVNPDAEGMLATAVESFLGRLRPRLDELRQDGKDRLWIVPHGPLHYYPFHLTGSPGTPIADTWTVTYLPNLGLLRKRPGHASSGARRRVPITSFGLTCRDDQVPSRPELLRAAEEAKAIAALFGAQATPEPLATKSNVLSALHSSRYVHIAAHGGHNTDASAFQSVFLAGTGTESVLFAHELLSHDLRGLELVTLSACETALGRFDRHDNLQGLPSALLLAGAQTIIGTLWQVSDDAAAVFFPTLYQCLARGLDVFEAFRIAQAKVRSALPQYWDWGAFYLIGGIAR
jgi:CHAT domain-containing protein/tetratricopeptide (TPR) repeat protein